MQLGQCNLWSQMILPKKHQMFFVENLYRIIWWFVLLKLHTYYLLLNRLIMKVCGAPHAH